MVAFRPFHFSYHHTACRQVHNEPNPAATASHRGRSHSRRTEGANRTMDVCPHNQHNQQKIIKNDRHLGSPDRNPRRQGAPYRAKCSCCSHPSRRHSEKVHAMPPSPPTQTPPTKRKVMRRVSQYAIPANNHIPPCQHSSPMALAGPHRGTSHRIPIRGFPAWDLFVAQSLLSGYAHHPH